MTHTRARMHSTIVWQTQLQLFFYLAAAASNTRPVSTATVLLTVRTAALNVKRPPSEHGNPVTPGALSMLQLTILCVDDECYRQAQKMDSVSINFSNHAEGESLIAGQVAQTTTTTTCDNAANRTRLN